MRRATALAPHARRLPAAACFAWRRCSAAAVVTEVAYADRRDGAGAQALPQPPAGVAPDDYERAVRRVAAQHQAVVELPGAAWRRQPPWRFLLAAPARTPR